MNTWASFAAGQVALIVLHSVPPLVVFVAAEAITEVRDKLTDAVAIAVRAAEPVNGPAETVHEPDTARTPFAEYLAEARSAWSPDVEVTPAWVRRTTGCSRGLSSRLARALAAEVAGGWS